MDQSNHPNRPLPNNGMAVVPGGVGGHGGFPVEYQRPGGAYPYYPQIDLTDTPSAFDFYKYLRILTKYRWLIVGTIATTLAIATVLTLLMTPIFRATSSIQIDREAMSVVKVGGLQPDESQGGLEFYQTQYELLASRSLAERVVATLALVNDSQFNVETKSLLSTIRSFAFGDRVGDSAKSQSETGAQSNRAVARLGRVLTITPVRGSRIVKINIDHPDPLVAQLIANGFAEVFIADNLDRRYDATSYARKFLEDRLQQLKIKLEESEKLAVKYAEEQGIINLTDNKNLSSTDLEAVNIKLAEARSERIKKELLWKQAKATGGLGLKEILDSTAIQENQKVRTQLAAEYQQKLAIYKPAFPEMIQLRNQIKELDRQVQTEVAAIKQSILAGYLAAKEEEENLQAQLELSKADVVDQRNRSIQYNILQREVDTNRQLYDGLLQRYKEIGVAGGVGTNNISIVDKATVPLSPRSPNMPMNIALGIVAGLLLGCLMAIGLDFLDDSFKAPEDIERELGLSVIGVVPKPQAGLTLEEEMANARSGMSEAYRSVRTGLQFSTSEGLPRTLLVTSSKPSEGKTTTTINLARTLAQIGHNVLLIDGDLRNASVHKRMAQSNELGLSNYLSGARSAEDVVQSTDTDRLVLMTSGPLPPNPAELLSGAKFASLLALAAESFDVVLIDGPPVMGLADAPLLSSMTQATLLVVAANETRRSTVKIALKRLQFARANIIGALLNKFDIRETEYGYGYGDYSYHSYGAKELPDLSR
jgi:polysaccharide biosynthesis transport protein